MTRNVALTGPVIPGQESANSKRRTFVGGALAALMAAPRLAVADDDKKETPNDPFILLLQGIYQPVPAGTGPQSNLGLTTVNLNDGSYSTTQIYPVYGIGGNNGEDNLPKRAIGRFYVQFGGGGHCAYDLPGGAIAMRFTGGGFTPHDDGQGGQFLEGTFELTIIEATGVYRAFQGGHNHMVDRLHHLANGQFDEFCFCNISTYQFP